MLVWFIAPSYLRMVSLTKYQTYYDDNKTIYATINHEPRSMRNKSKKQTHAQKLYGRGCVYEMDWQTKCHRNGKRRCLWNGWMKKCKKHENATETDLLNVLYFTQP